MKKLPPPGQLRMAFAMAALVAAVASVSAALPYSDVAFMKDAAQAGRFELEASVLAETRSESDGVKRFAAQMLEDHKAAETELKQLADKKKVALPEKPTAAQQAALRSLAGLKGIAFDQAYTRDVGVNAHTEAVALFRKAAVGAKDAEVKTFASTTLPVLEHHLDMAKELAAAR